MGLDMYLIATRYLSADAVQDQALICTLKAAAPTAFQQPTSIVYEVGYWRKANAIHAWFVKQCGKGDESDNCRSLPVSCAQLQTLLTYCERVKAQPKLGPTLLPPQEGFFFGSTDYGASYVRALDETITILTQSLVVQRLEEDRYNFTYRASW